MSEALTKLSTRERHLERRLANANVEIAQMEENNQEADVILEEAREENTALVRNIEELSAANAQYVEGLAVARVGLDENIYLRQQLAAAREELERIRSSIAPAHVDALTAQNHYLEDELAEAQGKLDQMRAFLGPGPIPRTHN